MNNHGQTGTGLSGDRMSGQIYTIGNPLDNRPNPATNQTKSEVLGIVSPSPLQRIMFRQRDCLLDNWLGWILLIGLYSCINE